MITLKITSIGKEILLAACDEELVGQTFRDGMLKIDVKESFYKGEPADCLELSSALKKATIANLVGEQTVRCAIECGAIDKNNVIYIKNIPHAQMVRM